MSTEDLLTPEARSMITGLRVMFPGAIIAGGYLRDIFFGKPPKDVDVFVPKLAEDNPFVVCGSLVPECAGQYMHAEEVGMVFKTPWTVDGLPVQIIEMAEGLDPAERVALHDFDFCQVWTDGWAVHGLGKLELVEATRTVTLAHCEDGAQFARSMRRWERLSQRYPEFTLHVPQHIEALI